MNTIRRDKLGEIYNKFFDFYSEDNLEDVFQYLFFAGIISEKQYNEMNSIGDKIWQRMKIADIEKLKEITTVKK